MGSAKVCAFTVIKNGNRLGYPWIESILAVLPYVDRFHVQEGVSDDDTLEWVKKLADYSPKITWSTSSWPRSVTGFAIGRQTNICMDEARLSGADWLWLVQSDELYSEQLARTMRGLFDDLRPECEGIEVNFLHLQNNFQQIQEGAGYQSAIRAVRNRPHIKSYRDAWTFEGCRKVFQLDPRTPPLVHANRTYWHNIPLKLRSHFSLLYPDLAHYRVSAEEAEKLHEGEPPEIFTRSTSPYDRLLPDVVKPTVGWLAYFPREALLHASK